MRISYLKDTLVVSWGAVEKLHAILKCRVSAGSETTTPLPQAGHIFWSFCVGLKSAAAKLVSTTSRVGEELARANSMCTETESALPFY
jgi:hypothetical protein